MTVSQVCESPVHAQIDYQLFAADSISSSTNNAVSKNSSWLKMP